MSFFYLGYSQKKEDFTVNSQDAVSQLTTLLQQMSSNMAASNASGSAMTPEQQSMNQELVTQLNNLNASLQILINQNRLITPPDSESPLPPDINILNDAKIQQMKQDDSINALKSRLANLQKIYNTYLQKKTESSIKYDKIPVYSSCIVSEADGRYTYPTNAP
jgi:hypothetical protein